MLPAYCFSLALALAYKIWLPAKLEVTGASRPNFFLYTCALAVIAMWSVRLFPLLTSTSYTPDEAWFVYDLVVRNDEQGSDGYFWWFGRYFAQANLFGYGGIWWGLYSLIVDFTSMLLPPTAKLATDFPVVGNFTTNFLNVANNGNEYLQLAMKIMRVLSFSVANVFFLRVSRRILKEPMAALGVVLMLTMPMMYWSGKLASPEYFGAFLLLISAFEYFENKNQNWFFLSGIACSVKLTCAPVAVALFLCALPTEWRRGGVKSCFTLGLKFAAGLLLANFYLLTNPREFVDYLLMYSSLFPAAPWKLSFMYGPLPFWDGGTYGNLSYWFGSLLAFSLTAIVSLFANPRLGLWLIVSTAAMFLFMLTQPLHNWYWFPVILGSVIPVAFTVSKRKSYRVMLATLFLAIASVNLFYSLDNITSEINFRKSHIAEYKSFDEDEQCVELAITSARPNVVYDLAMIGRVISLLGKERYENYPTSFSVLPSIEDLRENTGRMAIIGPRAATVTPIATFIEKAVTAGAEHGQCGKTLWLKF